MLGVQAARQRQKLLLVFAVVFDFWPVGVEGIAAFEFDAVVDVVTFQTGIDDFAAIDGEGQLHLLAVAL